MKKSIVAMRTIIVGCTILLGIQSGVLIADEGELVRNALIDSIAVGNNNKDGFSIVLNSGDGECDYVAFYEPIVTTARWKALLTMATTAMLSQKAIRVYSHADGSDCLAATFISISN